MTNITSDMMPPGANMGDDPPEEKDAQKKKRGDNIAERYVKKKIRKTATKTAKGIGRRITTRMATQAAVSVVRGAATAVVSSPVGWIIAAIIIVIIILMFFFFNMSGSNNNPDESETTPGIGQTTPPIPGFTLRLEGPEGVENGTLIRYIITYTYNESGTVPLDSITIYNDIPSTVSFVNATGNYSRSGNTISWPLEGLSNSGSFEITFRPSGDDVFVINKAYARTTVSVIGGGNLGNLLPAISGASTTADEQQQAIANIIKSNPELLNAYQTGEAATGVPWQILAALHYREGSLDPNVSLASGRRIGENEPDIIRGGGCSATYTPGEPVASGGGCIFRSFADSVIWAANHFKGKVGGQMPTTYQGLSKALACYNGCPGNANCPNGTPYNACPARFVGDDNPYVMNYYDQMHASMYIIYCADLTRCNPPARDQRPGTLSVILGLTRF